MNFKNFFSGPKQNTENIVTPPEVEKFASDFYQKKWKDQSVVVKTKAMMPEDFPYKKLTNERDSSRFGECLVNPESANFSFEGKLPFIVPDLVSMEGNPNYEVFKKVIEKYGKDYYIPGLEYSLWLSNKSGELPHELTKYMDDTMYHLIGSVFTDPNGVWDTPQGMVRNGKWAPVGTGGSSSLGHTWSFDDKIVLFRKD